MGTGQARLLVASGGPWANTTSCSSQAKTFPQQRGHRACRENPSSEGPWPIPDKPARQEKKRPIACIHAHSHSRPTYLDLKSTGINVDTLSLPYSRHQHRLCNKLVFLTMPKSLEKTRKRIAKKRNGNVVLHEFSRDTKKLHKAQVRDERLEKLAAARKKHDQPLSP